MSVGAEGEPLCNHYALPLAFEPFGKGRYRVVMPSDGSVIHRCPPATARSRTKHPVPVGGGCDHDQIFALFGSRRSSERELAIAYAYFDEHADVLLAQMLDTSRDAIFEKVWIGSHLGDLEGDAGVAALERAAEATGPGARDLRCTALLALAKRRGAAATPQLRAALAYRDGAVKDYAVIGLAAAGDVRAWDDVFDHLPAVLRRKRRVDDQSNESMALAYLAQHVSDSERLRRLVHFIREHWVRINEAEWFSRFWPEASPNGPPIDEVPVPDAARINAWVRDPLFRPLGPPLGFGGAAHPAASSST